MKRKSRNVEHTHKMKRKQNILQWATAISKTNKSKHQQLSLCVHFHALSVNMVDQLRS